jgi:hypothetical protein
MLRLDRSAHKFIAVPGVKMSGIGLLERTDLQWAIRNSPNEFFKEELGEDLELIGEEVRSADMESGLEASYRRLDDMLSS